MSLPGLAGERNAVVIQKLALVLLFAVPAAAVFPLGGRIALAVLVVLGTEKAVEKGEGGGFAIVLGVAVAVFDLQKTVLAAGEGLHGLHHFAGEAF